MAIGWRVLRSALLVAATVATLSLHSDIAMPDSDIVLTGNNVARAGLGEPFPKKPVGDVTFEPRLVGQYEIPADLVDDARALAELVDWNDSDFLGSGYDSESGKLFVAASTPRGRKLISREGLDPKHLTIVDAEHSLKELQNRLTATILDSPELQSVRRWGVDAQGGAYVLVEGGMTQAEATVLDGALDVPVRVSLSGIQKAARTETQLADPSAYAGAARFGASEPGNPLNHRCTTAFGQLTDGADFILTAGHCMEFNTAFTQAWIFLGANGGEWTQYEHMGNFGNRTSWNDGVGTRATADGDLHGDVSITRVSGLGNSVGTKVWVANNTKRSVVSRHAPTEGEYVCRSGATTRERCGFRTSDTNTNLRYDNGDVLRNVDLAHRNNYDECSLPGDSGGAVYTYQSGTTVAAVGVISGFANNTDGSCDLVFTGAEEALQAWGGRLDLA